MGVLRHPFCIECVLEYHGAAWFLESQYFRVAGRAFLNNFSLCNFYMTLSRETSVLGLITTPPLFLRSGHTTSRIETYGVTKNNPSGNFLTIQTQYILLLGEQVLTIFLCVKRVRLYWNFIIYDVQSATYSSHGAPCPARDLFPWLNTRVKVHISLWTIREISEKTFSVPLGLGGYLLSIDMGNKHYHMQQSFDGQLIWKRHENHF